MKVFISWSKPTSQKLASVLGDWLPDVIQEIKPWMSHEDIDKGQRWAAEVGAQLGELGQGILCITAENQREPWLNFEAGALAKSLEESRVRPILLDLKPSDLTGPLAQFQSTVATEKEDMFRLVASLNESCVKALDNTRLRRYFDRLWGDYLEQVKAIPPSGTSGGMTPSRSANEMLGEVLERVRELQRSQTSEKHDSGAHRRAGRDFAVVLKDGLVVTRGDTVIHQMHGSGRAEVLISSKGKLAQLGVSFEKGARRVLVPVSELMADPFANASFFDEEERDADDAER
ncbi:toll/interleukin-1 receptor domain-containing protein [Micromonospora sp. NBC_01740]|uniref:TIR domain-containing protein n=1 Tax=Micromonospora sp. NBC_01740 TaxID=2975986 RepID=UPI002E1199C8|nr:toll/interleukin-1 receptor domain-containing protein [Micromonospora sp. NBC_01740]